MSRQSVPRNFYGRQTRSQSGSQSTPTSTRRSRVYQPRMGLLDNFFDTEEEDFSHLEDPLDTTSYGNSSASFRINATSPLHASSFAVSPSGSGASPSTTLPAYHAPALEKERVPGFVQPTPFTGSDVSALLQQQQGLLTQILKKQEAMEKRQEAMKEKQSEIEAKILELSGNQENSPPDSAGKRKRVVNKDLSVSLIMYATLEGARVTL